MKRNFEQRGLKMFSLTLTLEDVEKLNVIKKNMKYTTLAQAVKHLLNTSDRLEDYQNIKLK